MEQLEHLPFEIWEQRMEWFENLLDEKQHLLANYLVNDHATGLLVDLQCCYCAGAWLAVVVLSVSIIDAQLRGEAMSNIGTAQLLKNYFSGENIDWLRKLRNSYVHADVDQPSLDLDDQYLNREKMRTDAENSIKMVIHAFFQSPGV